MVAKQRIRMANEKHSKNITQRGNVAKTSVRKSGHPSPCRRRRRHRGTEARAGAAASSPPDPPDSGLQLRWNLGREERSVRCRVGDLALGCRPREPGIQVVSLHLKLDFPFCREMPPKRKRR